MTEKEINQKWIEFSLGLIIVGVEMKFEEPTSIFGQTIYKISVPEKHELIEGYNPEKFMKEIKEEISELIYKTFETETKEEKDEIRKLFKVLGKVRNETWTQEKYDEKCAQITKEIELLQKFGGYKEI